MRLPPRLDQAYVAARARVAQKSWAEVSLGERIGVVLRFARLTLQHRERLLDVVQWETGKSRVHATI
jgi:succinate-semialdehyde dehydrogenase / glutarate-semialdehyde dehydrogenase